MKTQQNDRSVTAPPGSPLSRLAWLIVGVGIGAAAGILLAPQSGENTRDWISGKYKTGMRSMNSQVRQATQSVGDWIGQSQHQVSEAVSAGREAFSKAKNGA
jgi:gas vesicle protein